MWIEFTDSTESPKYCMLPTFTFHEMWMDSLPPDTHTYPQLLHIHFSWNVNRVHGFYGIPQILYAAYIHFSWNMNVLLTPYTRTYPQLLHIHFSWNVNRVHGSYGIPQILYAAYIHFSWNVNGVHGFYVPPKYCVILTFTFHEMWMYFLPHTLAPIPNSSTFTFHEMWIEFTDSTESPKILCTAYIHFSWNVNKSTLHFRRKYAIISTI